MLARKQQQKGQHMSRLRLAVLMGLYLPGSMAMAQSEAACEALAGYLLPGSDLRITVAEHAVDRTVRAGPGGQITLPPHCHIEGDFDRRTGVDGKAYALRFALNLPDDWNGRFLFQGGGGLNGNLGEPLGNQASGGRPALSRGFAVASTDSGHQAQGGFDDSFKDDQEALLNFFLFGNARVTEKVRPIVESYYADGIDHSYFVGCSTGGREGMIMAQRFPLLFDGIVSGAPAIRTGVSNLALRWFNVNLNRVAERQEGMGVFTRAEQDIIMTGILNSCDALDGMEDGLIFNTQACNFDPRELACSASNTTACIAPEKAAVLAVAVSGPKDSTGFQVYPRFPWDSGMDDGRGGMPGMINGGALPPEGPNAIGLVTQDVDAEFRAATAFDAAIGDAMSYNLSTFTGHGGKQIFYHGNSDGWFSAMETARYYDALTANSGGLQTTQQFSRLFLVPGMGHCAGGEATLDQFDLLTPIVDWVENGAAPEAVTATGNTMPGQSRPLCPWPAHTQYNGSGDPALAENYSCVAP
jgi:hypothetical protein